MSLKEKLLAINKNRIVVSLSYGLILVAIGFFLQSKFLTYHLCYSPTSAYNPQGYKCSFIPVNVLSGWFIMGLGIFFMIKKFFSKKGDSVR